MALSAKQIQAFWTNQNDRSVFLKKNGGNQHDQQMTSAKATSDKRIDKGVENMLVSKDLNRIKLLMPILGILLIGYLNVQKAEGISIIDNDIPIYNISIPENTQRDIWQLCEERNLSFELALSVLHIDRVSDYQVGHLKTVIEDLVDHRDYWAKQGFSDETVYDLMLISRQRGIAGCINFMQKNDSYDQDKYLQRVTAYKYALEQGIDPSLAD